MGKEAEIIDNQTRIGSGDQYLQNRVIEEQEYPMLVLQ